MQRGTGKLQLRSASPQPARDTAAVLRSAARWVLSVILFATPLVELPVGAQPTVASFDSLVASATSAREQGDVSTAIKFYRLAVELKPEWPDGWWFLGTLQYGSDQYQLAHENLTHYIELMPNAGPALALRGLCEFEEGLFPESLQDLERGIALGAANQPKNAKIILYHEALLLTRLGKFEEAIGKYTVLVKQGTVNEDVTTGIGLAGLRMPIFPKDLDPARAPLAAKIGQAAIDIMGGDLPGGHQAFQEIFDRFPTTPNVHYLYGYLLFATDPDQAVALFRQELAVSPSSAIAHAMLAWAHGMRGDFAEALPDARKAAAEDPALPMGQLVLGRSLVETGDLSGGLPYLESVLRMEPGNLEAHLALVKAYSKLGRKEDARRERLLCLTISG